MIIKTIRRGLFSLLQKTLYKFVKTQTIGPDTQEYNLDTQQPIIYSVFYSSLSERLVIDKEVQKLGWPSAYHQQTQNNLPTKPFFSLYRRSRAPFQRKPTPVVSRDLIKQAQWLAEHPESDVQIVPVRVFWGRAPEKERSFLRIWLQLSGTFGGRLATLMAVLLNGRNTFVHFSRPISMRELYLQEQNPEKLSRKVARILRVHNRQVTASVLGPDLSHRRTLVHQIPNKPLVLKAIEEEAKNKNISKDKARKLALKYADEIASNISYTNVRFLDVVLTWVWNKIYAGVAIHNIDILRDVNKDNEIIYVPCHRSHIDYLLLSYVLYHNGLQLPHIAAGVNLNMPIVGAILRRGGAFFMRRTFRDNPLYAVVFDEYLHSVFSGGYAAEYFVEGGRSRTGRTLNPKAGMLAMTVRSYLRDSRKPIIFMPVYTGYEKVFEANSYLGELRGKEKKNESIFDVLGAAMRALKDSFGRVNVTFGQPIYLTEVLNKHQQDWQQQDYSAIDYRPDWAVAAVDDLAQQVAKGINAATSVNPINLMALSILTTPKQAMDEQQLARQLEAYCDLLSANPYHANTVLPEGDGLSWIAYAEELKSIERNKHKLGDIIQTNERQSVILTYYRNNVLHLLALPSLIACLFINNQRYQLDEVQKIVQELYPFLQAELFLHWNSDEIAAVVEKWVNILQQRGYLLQNDKGYHSCPTSSNEHVFLESLAANMMQTLERYFLTLTVLQQDSHCTNAKELEEQCTLLAQRISVLYGINAPEFFDKALFRTLIQQLQQLGLINADADKLCFNPKLQTLAQTLEQLLNSSIRQSILRGV